MLSSLQRLVTASCYFNLNSYSHSFNPSLTMTAKNMKGLTTGTRRRSARLLALQECSKTTSSMFSTVGENCSNNVRNKKAKVIEDELVSIKEKKRKITASSKKVDKPNNQKRRNTTKKKKSKIVKSTSDSDLFLPRTREDELKETNQMIKVMGVDEAGRGPLAGPVVAAAAIVSQNIPGVTDSKKITKEEDREVLYEKIISSPNVSWSVAIVDAKRIDEINILQGTLEAMKMAATALISPKGFVASGGKLVEKVSSQIDGCYAIYGSNDQSSKKNNDSVDTIRTESDSKGNDDNADVYYALIDGNRLPKEFPCASESMIKGDSKEYAIGAASILAKVTRDRLMREYDTLFPEYELSRHKGKKFS
jgi:ribonuclease HII